MDRKCRYCQHKIDSSRSYVTLFKSQTKAKKPLEEHAHLPCYTQQLFSFVNNLTQESVKLLQAKGFVI